MGFHFGFLFVHFHNSSRVRVSCFPFVNQNSLSHEDRRSVVGTRYDLVGLVWEKMVKDFDNWIVFDLSM